MGDGTRGGSPFPLPPSPRNYSGPDAALLSKTSTNLKTHVTHYQHLRDWGHPNIEWSLELKVAKVLLSFSLSLSLSRSVWTANCACACIRVCVCVGERVCVFTLPLQHAQRKEGSRGGGEGEEVTRVEEDIQPVMRTDRHRNGGLLCCPLVITPKSWHGMLYGLWRLLPGFHLSVLDI